MKRIHNPNVKRSYKRLIITLIIGILLLLLGALFTYLGTEQNHKDIKGIKYLNDIIEKEKEKVDKRAYLDITYLSPKVAIYDDTTDAYYFAFDGTYYYLVYLKEVDAKIIEKEDLKEKAYHLTGVTKEVPKDVKEICIEVYNEYLTEEGQEVYLSDFDKIFGDVALNATVSYTESTGFYHGIAFFFYLIGALVSIPAIINIYKFQKNVKNMSDGELERIEREMDEKESFYYQKKNLYLTKDHIVLLDGRFQIYSYQDIVWMHPFEQRYNGIKTNKAIKIHTKDGKSYLIVDIPIHTKKDQAIYDEIWDTIIEKNPKIKLGYIKENIDYFNEVKKEAKLSQKR